MSVNQELLDQCEDFFELILNEEQNEEIDFAVDSLRHFLEKDIDGFTQHSNEKLALAVQSRLSELWDLISEEELETNEDLQSTYQELLGTLEEMSGYEADDE